MALPQLRKSWTRLRNWQQATTYPALFLALKNIMKALGWTVVGSSDAATAALDGADRWIDTGDLVVHATNPRSWIVLEQPTGAQVCLHFNFGTGVPDEHSLEVSASPSGVFAGGSTTARPTAADEFVVTASASSAEAVGGSQPWRLHGMSASDGTWTYVLATTTSGGVILWFFGAPVDAAPGWTNPWVAYARASAGFSELMYHAKTIGNHKSGGGPLYGVTEATMDGGGSLSIDNLAVPNELSGEYQMQEVGLYYGISGQTGPIGELGVLPDLWFVSSALNTGDRFPGDGSGQIMVMQDTAISWAAAEALL